MDPFSIPQNTNVQNPLTRDPSSPTGNNPLQPNNPSNQQNGQIPGTPDSSNQPSDTPNNSGSQKSPIDKFSHIFDNKKQDQKGEGKEKEAAEETFDLMKNIPDAKAFVDTYKKARLVNGEDPQVKELAEKALTGDASSLIELLNSVSQTTAANAVHHSLRGSMKNVSDNIGVFQKQTVNTATSGVRQASITGGIRAKFPALENVPANQLNEIVSKFIEAEGSKSDSEILGSLSEYLPMVYNVGSSSEEKKEQESKSGGTDWSTI